MSTPGLLFGLRGAVVKGHQRGGTMLGFPTANVGLDDAALAALQRFENGVYFGWASVEGDPARYPMVMSVGFNPHFKDKALTAEVHFVHKFTTDFYGATIRVAAVGKLREQCTYKSLEDLITAIKADVAAALDGLKGAEAAKDCSLFGTLTPEELSQRTFVTIPARPSL